MTETAGIARPGDRESTGRTRAGLLREALGIVSVLAGVVAIAWGLIGWAGIWGVVIVVGFGACSGGVSLMAYVPKEPTFRRPSEVAGAGGTTMEVRPRRPSDPPAAGHS